MWRVLAGAYDAGDKEVDVSYVREAARSHALLPLGRMLVRSPRAVSKLAKGAAAALSLNFICPA